MNSEWLNKITRRATLWAEIKAKEQEYFRLCKQVEEIEQRKRDVCFEVQKKLAESQDIADFLLGKEYEALKSQNI